LNKRNVRAPFIRIGSRILSAEFLNGFSAHKKKNEHERQRNNTASSKDIQSKTVTAAG